MLMCCFYGVLLIFSFTDVTQKYAMFMLFGCCVGGVFTSYLVLSWCCAGIVWDIRQNLLFVLLFALCYYYLLCCTGVVSELRHQLSRFAFVLYQHLSWCVLWLCYGRAAVIQCLFSWCCNWPCRVALTVVFHLCCSDSFQLFLCVVLWMPRGSKFSQCGVNAIFFCVAKTVLLFCLCLHVLSIIIGFENSEDYPGDAV